MSSLVSYADITCGTIFFELPGFNEESLSSVLLLAKRRKQAVHEREEYIDTTLNYLLENHKELFAHEWCHILQGLAYPGLFLRTVREMWMVENILGAFRSSDAERLTIPQELTGQYKKFFYGPTLLYSMQGLANGTALELRGVPSDQLRGLEFSEIQLLEEDASIFQYKVMIEAEGDGQGYRRWLRHQPRYSSIFNMLRRFFDDQGAYIALPPLVRYAYSTTRPVETFALLTARSIGTFGSRGLATTDVDAYSDWLRNLLPNVVAPPNMYIVNARESGVNDPNILIDVSMIERIHSQADRHPLYRQMQLLLNNSEMGHKIRYALLHPFLMLNFCKKTVDLEVVEYLPPLTHIRIHHSDLRIADSLFRVAPVLAGKPTPFMGDLRYDEWLPEFIGRKHLAISLMTDLMADKLHNCHHTGCPLYASGLCRRWYKIPIRPEDCEFPAMMEIATYYRYDTGSNALVRTRPITIRR